MQMLSSYRSRMWELLQERLRTNLLHRNQMWALQHVLTSQIQLLPPSSRMRWCPRRLQKQYRLKSQITQRHVLWQKVLEKLKKRIL
mmetsp:Transcript_81666/g.234668  ORF Transcript_81666/g.234668 Transcript_81666/m.234668 type:complete len:86 (-) Transcript_81666:165-422(-)